MLFIACYCIHCPALTSVGEKRWTVRGITELFGLVLFRHGARTLSKSFIGAIALYVLTSLEFQVQLFCWPRFVDFEKIHDIHLSNASKNHKKTRIGLVCAVHHMESWLVGARTTLQRCVWSTSHTVIAYPKHTKVQCKWKWSRSGMLLVAKISGRGVLTTARAKGSLKQPLLADIYAFSEKYGIGEQRDSGVQTWAPKGKMKMMIAMSENTNNPNQNSEGDAQMHTLKQSWAGSLLLRNQARLHRTPVRSSLSMFLYDWVVQLLILNVVIPMHTGPIPGILHRFILLYTASQAELLVSHLIHLRLVIARLSTKKKWTPKSWCEHEHLEHLISPRHITTQHICQ